MEARPGNRWPKTLKTKLVQGELPGSSPLRSDGLHGLGDLWPKTLKMRVGKGL